MSVLQTLPEGAKPASKTLALGTLKTVDKENLLNGQLKRNPTQPKKPGTKKTFGMIQFCGNCGSQFVGFPRTSARASFGKAERVPLADAQEGILVTFELGFL
jgi:hypothetical protein